MKGVVASHAKRDAVRQIVSFIWVIRIRIKMMRLEVTASGVSTHLAGVLISLVHGLTPLYILGSIAVCNSVLLCKVGIESEMSFPSRSCTFRADPTLTAEILSKANRCVVAAGSAVADGFINAPAGSALLYLSINLVYLAAVRLKHCNDINIIIIQARRMTVLDKPLVIAGWIF